MLLVELTSLWTLSFSSNISLQPWFGCGVSLCGWVRSTIWISPPCNYSSFTSITFFPLTASSFLNHNPCLWCWIISSHLYNFCCLLKSHLHFLLRVHYFFFSFTSANRLIDQYCIYCMGAIKWISYYSTCEILLKSLSRNISFKIFVLIF